MTALTRSIQIGLGLMLLAFAGTLWSFVPTWWNGYNYSQGFVLAPATVWLIWTHRRRLMERFAPAPELALLLVPVSLVWMAAVAMSVGMVTQLTLLAILVTWGATVFGVHALVWLLPAAATFSLGIPIWDALVRPLQLITVAMSSRLVQLIGIEAVIRGESITISYGTFVVEGSCAGAAFFLAGMTVAALYAHIFMRGWKTRVGVLVLAAAIAMLGNWIRVTYLVWLGEVTQMESPIIYDHGSVGWYIFTVSLIPFFFMARGLERWNDPPAAPPAKPELSPDALARGRRTVVLATAAALSGPVLYYGIGLIPARPPAEVSVTPASESWTLAADRSRAELGWELGYVGADSGESQAWVRAEGEDEGESGPVVYSDALLYLNQRQGQEMVGYPNRIAADSLVLNERSVGPLDASGRTVREAWVRGPDGVDLVWYWYRVGGGRTASTARAKILQLTGFLTRQESAGLLAVSTPCGEEDCQEAARALFEFVTGVVPEMPAPEGGEEIEPAASAP